MTTTFFGELPGLSGVGLVETVQVGDADEWLSVVVEGADEPLSVYLFDPLGRLAAEGDLLVDGSNAVGFDIAPTMSGTYTIQVLDTLGVPAVVEISISRTAVVQ